MYRPGLIMKAGTASDSGPPPGLPAAATTYVLDMTQANPTWQQTASMNFPRATTMNLVSLPDGNVMVFGGGTDTSGEIVSHAVLQTEEWSPATKTWQVMASMSVPRLYHSTTLLLPDGRVLESGSGGDPGTPDELNYQIYSPNYLFKGARPTITSAPTTAIQYGNSFFVGTPDAANISSVVLIRPGAVTHGFDQDQRYVPLTFTQSAGGLTVNAPANANLAPPGEYMLFIVNSNGVPSVAPFVRLPAPYEDTQAPTVPTNLAATGSTGSVSLTWTASTDNVGVAGYRVYRSTTSGFTPSGSNRVAQVTGTSYTDAVPAGTYYYLVTAYDAAGNESAPSQQATATATPDTQPPTVGITSPANGATVAGVVNVTASASDNVSVASVQFQLDSTNLGPPLTQAPYTYAWNTSSVANGTHTLTAIAKDASGNTKTSTAVAVTVSNTSLVASYAFNEGMGTTTADGSSNGNTGTLSNASWTISGKYGDALQFNGTNSMVVVKDAPSLDLTTGMTLEAWVDPTSFSNSGGNWDAAIAKEHVNSSNDIAYALYAAAGTGTPPAVHILVNGKDYGAQGSSVLPLNTWTFLAGTYDGTTLRIYVNGNLVGSTAVSGSIITTTDPLKIGGDWSNEMFTGIIDNVRIYNQALSQAQIQADMSG